MSPATVSARRMIESALVEHEAVAPRRRSSAARTRSRARDRRLRGVLREGAATGKDLAAELKAHVARRSAPSPARTTSSSPPMCRRRARERSCAGCCATSPPQGDRRHHDARRPGGRPEAGGRTTAMKIDRTEIPRSGSAPTPALRRARSSRTSSTRRSTSRRRRPGRCGRPISSRTRSGSSRPGSEAAHRGPPRPRSFSTLALHTRSERNYPACDAVRILAARALRHARDFGLSEVVFPLLGSDGSRFAAAVAEGAALGALPVHALPEGSRGSRFAGGADRGRRGRPAGGAGKAGNGRCGSPPR